MRLIFLDGLQSVYGRWMRVCARGREIFCVNVPTEIPGVQMSHIILSITHLQFSCRDTHTHKCVYVLVCDLVHVKPYTKLEQAHTLSHTFTH